MPRKIRRFLPVVAAAALATSGFAYMASNTVDASNAGQGSADISGYDVTNVHYTTATGGTHHKINGVDFVLTAQAPTNGTVDYKTPTEVFVELPTTSSGVTSPNQYSCSLSGTWSNNSGSYSCDMSAAKLAIADVSKLRVIAHQ